MSRYADIVLPLAQGLFTFELNESLSVEVGSAVVVPFGAAEGKYYTGVVWRLHNQRPNYKRIRSVTRVLYNRPLLSAQQQQFWEWIAQYYLCSVGEVMRVALPAMMKPNGSTDEQLSLDEFRPRCEYYITPIQHSPEEFEQIKQKLERRAPKQLSALQQIEQIGGNATQSKIPRRLLSCDMPTLQSLVRKGIISLEKCEVTQELPLDKRFTLPELTAAQSAALTTIEEEFGDKSTTLLHGITGSGKTEIYIHMIASRLERGEDVLLLLPEIALTAQLVERMERIFGSRVVVYHSKLTGRKRTETFLQINNREGGNFVVGVRSAIFLPLRNLKLIIVDEEHDASYKQSDPAPRYNARDAAVVMAAMHGAHTLLGSATPSLESWTNSQSGKYGFASLLERYGDAQPPTITISDTIRAVKRGERKGHFNFTLLDGLRQRLERGEQSILFQNRRGFAPYIECSGCGWRPTCPHCNVTLTLHKGQRRLSCHYCGYAEHIPTSCPECKATELKPMGFGTEKIEEQLGEILPTARISRLDRDTITSQQALNEIISNFENGRSDIMVGTQMVTKGFDFSRVTLVGILNADNMLSGADFRAEERAFQLMTQVAGRAGRRGAGGEVVIQTSQPDHRILRFVTENDYQSMARTLLSEREAFGYPPYARITTITMRYKDLSTLNAAANALSAMLRQSFARRLQGPVTPPIDRIRDEHIVTMMLKIESGASSKKAREILLEKIEELRKQQQFKYITIICNVDPQ